MLPAPTAITNTGRGLGLYYIFRGHLQSLKIQRNRESFIVIYIQNSHILQYYMQDKNLLEVDRVVVNDLARICAITGNV